MIAVSLGTRNRGQSRFSTPSKFRDRPQSMRSDLERFFNPRAIAIIGASQDFGTISGQPLKHLQSHGYKGKLYPVNPRYKEVGGIACYPSLGQVPETPDLVLILVNAARVP